MVRWLFSHPTGTGETPAAHVITLLGVSLPSVTSIKHSAHTTTKDTNTMIAVHHSHNG